MPKNYKILNNKPMTIAEPTVAYRPIKSTWNPNRPVHATQEEWWKHIRQIEQGKFYTLEEFNQHFDQWEQEYLAKKLR